MTSFFIGLIPVAIVLLTLGGTFAIIKFNEFRKRGKRSPLTAQLLRSPGETLRGQIDELTSDLAFYSMSAPVFPLFMYSSYLSQIYLAGVKVTGLILLVYVTVSSAIVIVFFVKLWVLFKKRNALRLGLDCELAVGQELNHLMLNGCRVYHDFPADKFNIDHVVVGPKGVFAVETKGRAKPDKKGGTAEATVTFDGEALKFPNGTERGYLDQAKRQATWLSKWLSSAAGDPVTVQPVLALPGWFIQRDKPSDMLIFNGKNPDLLLKWCRDDRLSEATIKRIVHQIDQRCRDVEPVAYSKK